MWLFASPWSPPAWMKDSKRVIQGGRLLPEHYQTWANYFARYLDEYKKEGVNFFGVTIQNEAKAVQTWESCIWTGKEEGEFAANFLRPTLDKKGFGKAKIDRKIIVRREMGQSWGFVDGRANLNVFLN